MNLTKRTSVRQELKTVEMMLHTTTKKLIFMMFKSPTLINSLVCHLKLAVLIDQCWWPYPNYKKVLNYKWRITRIVKTQIYKVYKWTMLTQNQCCQFTWFVALVIIDESKQDQLKLEMVNQWVRKLENKTRLDNYVTRARNEALIPDVNEKYTRRLYEARYLLFQTGMGCKTSWRF